MEVDRDKRLGVVQIRNLRPLAAYTRFDKNRNNEMREEFMDENTAEEIITYKKRWKDTANS
jgi:hypothetical protein